MSIKASERLSANAECNDFSENGKKRKNVNGGIKEGNLSLKQTDVKMGDAMLQRDT